MGKDEAAALAQRTFFLRMMMLQGYCPSILMRRRMLMLMIWV